MSHRIIGTTGSNTLDELNDVAITSAATLNILQHNGTRFINRAPVGAETLMNTAVAGANDTVIGANVRHYHFFTVPSTAALWIITKIEWLNGTVVNGNCTPGVEYVDAVPPVTNNTMLVAWGVPTAQTGASATQSTDYLAGYPVAAGRTLGAWIATASATGRYGTTTTASTVRTKAIAPANDFITGSGGSFTATTEEPYIKVYGKPILGV